MNEPGILLSVIVPVYNVETYIAKTLDSILEIDPGGPLEVIAVDDGSKDGSLEILREYEGKDSRVRVVTGENGGVSRARNRGIEAARGRYLTFVDGDDTAVPGFFREAIREMEQGGYGIAEVTTLFLEDGKLVKVYPGREKIPGGRLECGNREELLELFLGPTETIVFSSCGKVFSRELVGETRFPEGVRIGEDEKFTFDLLMKEPKVLILDMDANNYFIRESSAMHSGYAEKGWDAIAVMDEMEKAADSPRVLQLIRKRKTDVWVKIYNTAKMTGQDPGRALQAIRGTDLKAIRESLSGKERAKLVLLQRCRPLYDLLLQAAG